MTRKIVLQRYMEKTISAMNKFHFETRRTHILMGMIDATAIDPFAYDIEDIDRMYWPYGRTK